MVALWQQRKSTFDCYVNATRVEFANLTISQRLDQITSVASFDLVDQPTIPAKGDPVRIDWVNRETEIATTQFAGRIYARDTEGFPHRVGIIAQGPLGVLTTCLRQRSDGDLDLTGMTDGEAVEAILDYCGVTFDAADIADAGYVLGERADVFWHADGQTFAAQITDEIDRVFASKLQDIGNGRVIRGFYNLFSEAASGMRNYTRGADNRFYANRRGGGEITAIQNHWEVRGVSVDCGGAEGGCTCQPHASGHTDNATLETWTGVDHARAAVQTFDSEMIQDESLAAAIATRLMKTYNREPIELDAEVQSEPQLYPCRVVTVRDATYGIDLPTAQAITIVGVETRPESTSLTLIGGDPGNVGTITSSVEELCNDAEDTQDWPGDYVDPGFSDFPDLDTGDFTPFPDDGFGEFPEPEVPNTTDPFLDCTEAEDGGVTAAGIGCHPYASMTSLNYRQNGSNICYYTDEGGNIQEIRAYSASTTTLFLNLTTPIASKTSGNDVTLGTAPVLAVSFDIKFEVADATATIYIESGDAINAFVQLYAAPGFSYLNVGAGSAIAVGVLLHTENQGARLTGFAGEGECTSFSLSCNDGGVRLEGGFAVGMWHSVSFAFDLSGWPQKIHYAGPDGGTKSDVICWGPSAEFCFPDGTCDDASHTIEIRLDPDDAGTDGDDPGIRVRNLVSGYGTCAPNPDYLPEESPDEDS